MLIFRLAFSIHILYIVHAQELNQIEEGKKMREKMEKWSKNVGKQLKWWQRRNGRAKTFRAQKDTYQLWIWSKWERDASKIWAHSAQWMSWWQISKQASRQATNTIEIIALLQAKCFLARLHWDEGRNSFCCYFFVLLIIFYLALFRFIISFYFILLFSSLLLLLRKHTSS